MRILISNDDGIHAPGLKALERIARTLSDDVWIVAPELDQSGASHSLTLRDPLRLREVSDCKFAVNGTPTDCVMMGIKQILKEHRPDIVFSGVNAGANLAEDITYSGTVAAAMEGCLLGVPSVALSINAHKGHPAKWSTAEHFAPDILKKLLKIKLRENIFININFPNISINNVKGVRLASQGQRRYEASLIECTDPRGKTYYWVGPIDHDGSGDVGTDLDAISQGYISVTPLSLNFTHAPTFTQLQQVFS